MSVGPKLGVLGCFRADADTSTLQHNIRCAAYVSVAIRLDNLLYNFIFYRRFSPFTFFIMAVSLQSTLRGTRKQNNEKVKIK
jgi:hypothetical protein